MSLTLAAAHPALVMDPQKKTEGLPLTAPQEALVVTLALAPAAKDLRAQSPASVILGFGLSRKANATQVNVTIVSIPAMEWIPSTLTAYGVDNACTSAGDPCRDITGAKAGSCVPGDSLTGSYTCSCDPGYQFDFEQKQCVQVEALITGYMSAVGRRGVVLTPFVYKWAGDSWGELPDVTVVTKQPLYDVDMQSWPEEGYAYFVGAQGNVISLANDMQDSTFESLYSSADDPQASDCHSVSSDAGAQDVYVACDEGQGLIRQTFDGMWGPVAQDDNDGEGVKHTGVKVKYSKDGLEKIALRVTDATGVGFNGDISVLGYLSIWSPDDSAWQPVAYTSSSPLYAVDIWSETSPGSDGDQVTVWHAWVAGLDVMFKWSSDSKDILEDVTTPTYGIKLSGVAVVGSDGAFAVGSKGTILRNFDWNGDWYLQESTVEKDLTDVAALDANTAMAVGVDAATTPLVWNGRQWTQMPVLSPEADSSSNGYVITGVDMVSGITSTGGGGGGDNPDYNYWNDYQDSQPHSSTAAAASAGTPSQHRRRQPHSKASIANETRAANAAAHHRRHQHRLANRAAGTKPTVPAAVGQLAKHLPAQALKPAAVTSEATVPVDAAMSAAASVPDNTASQASNPPTASGTIDAAKSAVNDTETGSQQGEPQAPSNGNVIMSQATDLSSVTLTAAADTDKSGTAASTSPVNDATAAALPGPQGSPGRRMLQQFAI
eukprot:gene4776-5026_t